MFPIRHNPEIPFRILIKTRTDAGRFANAKFELRFEAGKG